MKFIGILLIITAGLGLGLYYSRRLYRRAEWLRLCERLLDALQDKLTYTAQPLAVLWEDFSNNAVFSDYPLVGDTTDGLRRGLSFYDAFDLAVTNAVSHGLILSTEETLLRELGVTLGRSDRVSQQQCILHCEERLAQGRQAVEELAKTRGRVYAMTGFAGGVCFALLML